MVPTDAIFMQELPVTATGKTDERALTAAANEHDDGLLGSDLHRHLRTTDAGEPHGAPSQRMRDNGDDEASSSSHHQNQKQQV